MDPTTSESWIQEFAATCLRSLHNAHEPYDWVTDDVLASAIETATRPKQHSVALYLQTVPVLLKSQRDSLTARCAHCDGSGNAGGEYCSCAAGQELKRSHGR